MTATQIDEIVSTYYHRLYKHCLYRTRYNTDLSEEITQEVFLLFLIKADTLEYDNILGWLLKTADYKHMELRRRRLKETELFTEYDAAENTYDRTVLCTWEQAELAQYPEDHSIENELEKILSLLTPDEHALYNAVHGKALPRRELAEKFGISENCLNVKIMRMNNKLKRLVKSAEISAPITAR